MTTSTPKTTGYVSGEDPDTVEANRVYQDALARLSQSLDTRKNKFFDPVWLAAAQGFLAPTQTGGFGESLGNVAKNVSAAQAQDIKEEQEIAQQRVAVAGQGIELQRMKQRDAELLKYLDGPQAPSGPLSGPQAGAVAGPKAVTPPKVGDKYQYTYIDPIDRKYGQSETRTVTQDDLDQMPKSILAGALSQAGLESSFKTPSEKPKVIGSPQGALESIKTNKPSGFEGVEGIQVMPANPDFMTARDYIRLNRMDKSKSAGDLIKEAQEINQKRYRDRDIGVVDLASGKLYEFPTGKQETVTIAGYPGTHTIDARAAARLSFLAMNDDPAYHDLAKQIMEGPRKRVNASAVEGKPADAGSKPSEAGGTPNVSSGNRKSVQELAAEQKEAEIRAAKLGEAGAAKEALVEENAVAASSMYGGATRVLKSLKESPNFFGVFARPGVVAAALGVLNEGIRTPNGSISLGNLESAVTKIMPGAKQSDIDNVNKAAAELAEMELIYTRLFLSKQGAVTEGERKIVRAIPGTISSSPEVLRSRMELIKLRTQKDMDVADAYRQWQDKNLGRSYLEFERKSDLYKDIKKNYESNLATMFDTIKAVPTSQRKQEAAPAGAPSPAGVPSPGFIRGPDGVIRRKKAGE